MRQCQWDGSMYNMTTIPSPAWADYKVHAQNRHADKLDLSDINPAFLPYFRQDVRVKVRVYGEEVTGTVGVTTGWRPSLLLMRRRNAIGSSYLLGHDAVLVAVQRGRKYEPVGPCVESTEKVD